MIKGLINFIKFQGFYLCLIGAKTVAESAFFISLFIRRRFADTWAQIFVLTGNIILKSDLSAALAVGSMYFLLDSLGTNQK